MLYYFFSLFIAAIIVLLNNHRSEMNRWASFFLCCASIGGLSNLFIQAGWNSGSQVVQLLNHTLTPYGVLIFCIIYSERFPRMKVRLYLKWLLLIPVVLMMVSALLSPEMNIDYRLLLTWVAPYYLISCYLLIKSLWVERDQRKKRNRFITTVIIVPTLLAVLLLINVGNVISPKFDYFQYVSLFMVYSFVVALLCTFVYGVLGVKLRFEHDPLESTMKAVSSGTSLLNHTLKNEIGKIAISSENLKFSILDQSDESLQHLQIISNASNHMLAMVSRIHSQTKQIVLREQPCQLAMLTDECVRQHVLLFENRGIQLRKSYTCTPLVMCDAVHMKEVIGNLLMNAAEALSDGGVIQISLDVMKKGIRLSFADNGNGIPANELARVFEPFYSTKNNAQSFGLGLSYVYNVMRMSGGAVEISSKEHEGTVVQLHYPHHKVLQLNRGNNDDGSH